MTPSDDKVDVEGLIAEGPKEWKWHAYHGVICQQAEEIARLTRNYQHTYEELQVVRASREQMAEEVERLKDRHHNPPAPGSGS